MKIYHLRTTAEAEGDIFDIKDGSSRVFKYFILNGDDGKFLKFTKPQVVAQEKLTTELTLNSDYLQANIGVPIFSQRARDLFMETFPNEVEFHECTVSVEGKELPFYLCKVLTTCGLIDKEASEYRPLSDGTPTLSRAIYRSSFEKDFYKARDRENITHLAVSERFVDLCRKHGLKIDFFEAPQK